MSTDDDDELIMPSRLWRFRLRLGILIEWFARQIPGPTRAWAARRRQERWRRWTAAMMGRFEIPPEYEAAMKGVCDDQNERDA
jgi:hypothetical protein